MATDGTADLAAQPTEFNLDDIPSAEAPPQADSRLEPLEGLEYLDDLSADLPLATPEEEALPQELETVTEEDTAAPAGDDDAALMERVKAHRLVKGDLERLSQLLPNAHILERTGPDTTDRLEQENADLRRRLEGQAPTPAPPKPQTQAQRVTAFIENFQLEHGREPDGPEIVEGLAVAAGRRAAEERFGELQVMTSLEQQYNTLVVEYPWAAERGDLVQRAAKTAGAMAMDGQAQPDDLLVAFRAVADKEIRGKAQARVTASRAAQAAKAAGTPAVEPAAEPGEALMPEPRTWDEIRPYNLRHFE